MNRLGIDQIVELANRKDHPFGSSLLNELTGLILLTGYSDLDARQIADIYSKKYQVNRTASQVETIHGWLPLVPNLEKLAGTKDARVRLIPVKTEQNQYLHFVSPEMKEIYGVLQLKHLKLDRTADFFDKEKLISSWGDPIFYDNLIEIKKAHNTG